MKKKLAIIGVICFVAFVVFGTIWVNSKGDKVVQLTEYGRQVAFLEEHEEEMTEFVKSQNSKIESVQFDWDSIETSVIGNGTPQGAGKVLTIDGKFNNIPDSSFYLQFNIDTVDKMPDIKNMTAGNSFRIGGLMYE